ncbi:hypothetical protein [Sphingobacterium chuzhouense]|uniref:Uncharacterized protein n=1 Tax=Sphingobacterium chuzhouense TaxID=1742264 RepID=A0ABR7XUX9_9SPHI|nr:hypothetical protein [Sphingobacterium chuzhouense]MBD1422837.1 hypothetical protein [Sphingobacterium chuzhouense]
MNTNENNEKPQTDRERGVAENEKANYSGFPPEESTDEKDKKDIKETNQSDKRDKEGGDLAGNAAGNIPPEEGEK